MSSVRTEEVEEDTAERRFAPISVHDRRNRCSPSSGTSVHHHRNAQKNPKGQNLFKKLQRKHGKGKALSILAHKLGRAAYHMLVRGTVFDMEKFMAD